MLEIIVSCFAEAADADASAIPLWQISSLCWSYGQSAPKDARRFFEMVAKTHPSLEDASGSVASADSVALLLWGCARCGVRDVKMMSAVLSWLQGGLRLEAASGYSAALLLWSFAELSVAPGASCNILMRCKISLHAARSGPAPIRHTAETCARQSTRPLSTALRCTGDDALTAMCERLLAADDSALLPEDLARACWAAGCLGAQRHFVEVLAERAARQAAALSNSDIAKLVRTVAVVDLYPGAFIAARILVALCGCNSVGIPVEQSAHGR